MSDKPLTREQLDALVECAQYDEQMISAVYWQTHHFMERQAKRFWTQYGEFCRCDAEDLAQCGYLALVEAIPTYKPEAGKSFLNWLDFYLKREFNRCAGFLNKHGKQSHFDNSMTSLDAPVPGYEDDELTLGDAVPAQVDHISNVEDRIFNKQLHDAFIRFFDKTLKPINAEIICKNRFEGKPNTQIAKEMGISDVEARNRINNTLMKMRRDVRHQYGKELQEMAAVLFNPYRKVNVSDYQLNHTSIEEQILLAKEKYGAIEVGRKRKLGRS